MRVLVCVQGYPDDKGNSGLMFIHQRNIEYVKLGIDVTVLNFGLNYCYEIDGVKVISEIDYDKTKEKYDILVLHAPNIRNHVRFLGKYNKRFKKIVFFFHGHEIVKIARVYPKPYDFTNDAKTINRLIQSLYDNIKILVLKKVLKLYKDMASYVFVSKSLFEDFQNFFGLTEKDLGERVFIINNGVGREFVENDYVFNSPKKYDFITIRSHFDSSVYCIDLLVSLANNNPDLKFLLIGKGDYFNYNNKPANIEYLDTHLTHKEMLNKLNESKAALMLTRRDSQGVMSCELASFGIPLFTSDIKVTREMFDGISNVYLLNNEAILSTNLSDLLEYARTNYSNVKCKKFFDENTVIKEINMLIRLNEG